MHKLAVRLRHGTSEPIHTEVNGDLLTRTRGLPATQAIRLLLQELPEEKRAYGQAMLATMQSVDSVIEVVNTADEEVVAVDPRRDEAFDQLLSRIVGGKGGEAGALKEIEIGTARLERGGTMASAAVRPAVGGGDRREAVPPSGGSLFHHLFFAATRETPMIVQGGVTYRLRRDPNATRHYFLFGGERFALRQDLSLREYDTFFFQDHSERFEKAIAQCAGVKVAECLRTVFERGTPTSDDISTFLVLSLIPRLRAFHLGQEMASRGKRTSWEPVPPRMPRPETPWCPERLPLCEALPRDVLIVDPGVYALVPHPWLRTMFHPDPGVYLPSGAFRIGSMQPLRNVEQSYRGLLIQRLDKEAARRLPQYTNALLRSQTQGEQVQNCRQLLEMSRGQDAEVTLFEDPYHTLTARQGTASLHRRVPACVLRSVADGRHYRCVATRVSITLSATRGDAIFYRGCVRAGPGYTHPLVDNSQAVLMDRCDNDIENLRNVPDLCGALIRHLNDARLMLEIGFDNAIPLSRRLTAIAPAEVERLGLPVYSFRHVAT
jgi:hypothetical protein